MLSISGQIASLDILKGKKSISVPFEYRQGFILVPIKFQFIVPMTFIFDTGAQNTIIFDKRNTDLINTIYSKEIKIKGADYSFEISALIARGIYLSTYRNEINVERDILVLKEDIVKLGELIGKDIHGIIGANFFKGLIVEIDYIRKKITFHDPNHFTNKKYQSFSKLPINIVNFKPYIKACPYIEETSTDSLMFLLDTGASISLLLHSDADSIINIHQDAIPGSLGKGMGGDIMGFISIIDSFQLDKNIVINRPVTYFQQFNNIYDVDKLYRDGIIGNTLLERFHVIIDYHNKWLYLKPNKNFKKEFKYNKSGMNIVTSGKNHNKFNVSSVYKNSPAGKAGIHIDDQIIRINWRPNFLLSIAYINKKLTSKEGTSLKLVILRNGKKLKKEIILRDLLNTSNTK